MSTGAVIGDKWRLGAQLGTGSFAVVKAAVSITEPGLKAAVKIFEDVTDETDLMKIENEIKVMKGLDHPACLKVLDVIVSDDESIVYVVMELATAELTARMEASAKGRLPEPQAANYFSQILDGIAYLHGQNVVHRDIKFENVLLDESDRVKLADFGMSKASVLPAQILRTRCGSTRYISPEVALLKTGDGPSPVHPVASHSDLCTNVGRVANRRVAILRGPSQPVGVLPALLVLPSWGVAEPGETLSSVYSLYLSGVGYDGRAMDVWASGVLLFTMLVGKLPFPQVHTPEGYGVSR
jgi:serine/threonine protein kinase